MSKESSNRKADTTVAFLADFGLSENEARVYAASLAMGPTTVQKIALQANLKRTTVYAVVESLRRLGLMNTVVDGFKRKYAPEDPERLEIILEQRKKHLTEYLPYLSGLFNLKGSSGMIKYYEGIAAVKNVYEALIRDIKRNDRYMVIANQDQWLALDERHFRDFTERRARMDIDIRMLITDGKRAREWKQYQKNYNCKVKILPKEVVFSVDIVITPQHMLIQPLHPPIMAMTIENEQVIQMQQELFEILWHSVKG